MRPIDADALNDDILKSAVMIDDRGIQTGYEIAIELIKRQPTVDAVPIEFIEKRIAELKKLNEYEFIANGGYTSPSDYEQWELERLIRDWREQNNEYLCR